MQLTERDLDARIADKRIFRVVGRDGNEVGRIFSAPKSCTGNCNQGRMCDCVADVEDNRPPITRLGIAMILAPWAVVLVIVLAAALY